MPRTFGADCLALVVLLGCAPGPAYDEPPSSASVAGSGHQSSTPQSSTPQSPPSQSFTAEIPAKGPSVAVAGTRLALNGAPRFLLGVSLFDALGPQPPSDGVLD